MESTYAQEPSQRARSRSRRLAAATAAAIAITAVAGAGGASADDLRLDNDMLPPEEPGLLQGMSAAPLPADLGFTTWANTGTFQLRKTYTLRLVGADSEWMRSAAVLAAQQVKAIGDVTITVAPGTLAAPSSPNPPPDGDIELDVDADRCGDGWAVACTVYPPTLTQFPSRRVWRINSGRIWLTPGIAARPAGVIRDIVAHELGHALGLGHYDKQYEGQRQVMNPYVHPDGVGVYQQGDKNGIQFVSSPPSQFALRNSNTGANLNRPEVVFAFGRKGDIPLKGDWDGDGIDTPGVFRYAPSTGATFLLRNSNTAGAADLAGSFPSSADARPIVGDWDGDGIDTIGIRTGSRFYLRNSNTMPTSSSTVAGDGDIVLTLDSLFDPDGERDKVVAGDWDGDGIDTIGIRRGHYGSSVWHFQANNTQSSPRRIEFFGEARDKPVVGDWDGNGTDTPGVKRGYQWILRNATTSLQTTLPGLGDVNVTKYGEALDTPIVGDWDGDGTDTVGAHH